jgi:hypothetical protein
MKKTASHPKLEGWTLTFDSSDHSYRDSEGRLYISGTSFIKQFFPEFDAQAAASRVAKRENRLEMEIIREWDAKGKASSAYGTRVHEYAEALINGTATGIPASGRENTARKAVGAALTMIGEHYDIIGAEQMVFDPLHLIAGTVDIRARRKATGALAVLDWKTCEEISDLSYAMALPPIQYIPDSKRVHYGLQLSLYGVIQVDTGYVPTETPVETALIHIQPDNPEPVWIELPYAPALIKALIMHHHERREIAANPPWFTKPASVGFGGL